MERMVNGCLDFPFPLPFPFCVETCVFPTPINDVYFETSFFIIITII